MGIILTQLYTLKQFFTQSSLQFSHVWLSAAPWTAACQASLSVTNTGSLLKLMSIILKIILKTISLQRLYLHTFLLIEITDPNLQHRSYIYQEGKLLLSFSTLISSSVQFSLSRVWLFATPWIAARQASLSITNSQSLLKLISIESVMSSNHLILC